jgi:hypothetical protein
MKPSKEISSSTTPVPDISAQENADNATAMYDAWQKGGIDGIRRRLAEMRKAGASAAKPTPTPTDPSGNT